MDVPSNVAVGATREPHAHGSSSGLALTALGVVFGDIGTSPLYAFSVALNATGHPPTAADVLGIVSLIFWALMAIVSLKYVVFVLRADNDGEGGVLALLSLVANGSSASAGACRSWSFSASWGPPCSMATASSRRRSRSCRRLRALN